MDTKEELINDEEFHLEEEVSEISDESISLDLESLKDTESPKKTPKKKKGKKIEEDEDFDNSETESIDEENDDNLFKVKFKTIKKTSNISKYKKPVPKLDYNVFDFLLGWRKSMNLPQKPDESTYKQIITNNVLDINLEQEADNLQSIFLNIQWDNNNIINNGKSIDFLKNLNLSTKLIRNGILFIWSEKTLLNEIIKILDAKNFIYIENFAVITLNSKLANVKIDINEEIKKPKKTQNLITSFFKKIQNVTESNENDKKEKLDQEQKSENYSNLLSINPINLFNNKKCDFFYNSKKVLLMFRRVDGKNSEPLELRHQRTSDVVFDMTDGDPNNENWKINQYIYKMIETLLPKANYEPNSSLKLMEMYKII